MHAAPGSWLASARERACGPVCGGLVDYVSAQCKVRGNRENLNDWFFELRERYSESLVSVVWEKELLVDISFGCLIN